MRLRRAAGYAQKPQTSASEVGGLSARSILEPKVSMIEIVSEKRTRSHVLSSSTQYFEVVQAVALSDGAD